MNDASSVPDDPTRKGQALEGFGTCTQHDIDQLDEVLKKWRESESEHDKARAAAGTMMFKLMEEKGAQRQAIAERARVNGQTVTHMAYGRPSRAELRRRAEAKAPAQ